MSDEEETPIEEGRPKRCGMCKWSEHKDIHAGLCRVNPPTLLMVQVGPGQAGVANSLWPAVHLDNDWCKAFEQGPMIRRLSLVPKAHMPLN